MGQPADPAGLDLRSLMHGVRSIGTRLDVPFNNYLETIYTDLLPNHEFLDLVQAAESFHSRTVGRYKTSASTGTEPILNRLRAKGVNNKDRKQIERALQALSPNEYSLSERLVHLTAGSGMPVPPSDPPPWIPSTDLPAGHIWNDWIGRARNDISHGNTPVPDTWLQQQNLYLRALIERDLLRELGLPDKHCIAGTRNRYNHSK